jgi:hypothetical protein
MADSDKDRGNSRRFGAEDRGWSSTGRILGCRTIERSGDAVCDLNHAEGDEEHEFLGLASKRWVTTCSTVTLVPLCTFSSKAARSL